MRALLDVDGVLGDFLEASLKVVNELNGFETPKESVTEPFFVDLIRDEDPEQLAAKKRLYWEITSAQGFCSSIRPFPEAQEAVEMLLLDIGVDLYVVTSFLRSSPTWTHDRNSWLDRHFKIPGRSVVHTKAKHTVAGDLFIDDTLHNVHKWRGYNPKSLPVLWKQPYNESDWEKYPARQGMVRTDSWEFILGVVENSKTQFRFG